MKDDLECETEIKLGSKISWKKVQIGEVKKL
jgi:hypothetical protein